MSAEDGVLQGKAGYITLGLIHQLNEIDEDALVRQVLNARCGRSRGELSE